MTYDAKTGNISLDPDSDFLSDSGSHFISVLRDLAQDPTANSSIKSDWKAVEDWLECTGRSLNGLDTEKIAKAWRAYYAIGVAPSHALQPAFNRAAQKYKSTGLSFKADRPPQEIMGVFDRLLASDEEIKEKKAWDWSEENPETRKLADAIRAVTGKPRPSWWRRQNHMFRAWVFVSIAWAATSFFYMTIFDPFDLGSWSYADGNDYLKAAIVMAVPTFCGLLKLAYDRVVN